MFIVNYIHYEFSGVTVVGASADGTKNYTYYLNVCGDLGDLECGETHSRGVSACQEDTSDGRTFILGMANKQSMRFGFWIMDSSA